MPVSPNTQVPGLPEPTRSSYANGHGSRLVDKGIHKASGLPVKEATQPLVLVVDEALTEVSVPGDPGKCALAQAARQQRSMLADVDIYASTAYAVYPNGGCGDPGHQQDVPHVDRYKIAGRTKEAIYAFDVLARVDGIRRFLAGTYWLSAPTKGKRLGDNAKPKAERKSPARARPSAGPALPKVVRARAA